jgi:hypothetical protein
VAHPGGNITGFSYLEPPVAAKWLELLKGIAPATGTMHRRSRYASLKLGNVRTVSHLALIGLRPPLGALHHCGIKPQRMSSKVVNVPSAEKHELTPVSAHREALKELTRARVPLDWAMSFGGESPFRVRSGNPD